MSHIVRIATQVKDGIALGMACRRLGLAEPKREQASMYSGQAEGLVVRLPGWIYPVICRPETGELLYDNYGGRWGEQKELDRLLQAYAVAKVGLEARRQGHSVVEQPLDDGSVKLTINLSTAS